MHTKKNFEHSQNFSGLEWNFFLPSYILKIKISKNEHSHQNHHRVCRRLTQNFFLILLCFPFWFKNKSKTPLEIENYLNEINFCMDLFSRVIFLTFHVDSISLIGYQWIFCKHLFSKILVLSMLYIFWFCCCLFFR